MKCALLTLCILFFRSSSLVDNSCVVCADERPSHTEAAEVWQEIPKREVKKKEVPVVKGPAAAGGAAATTPATAGGAQTDRPKTAGGKPALDGSYAKNQINTAATV